MVASLPLSRSLWLCVINDAAAYVCIHCCRPWSWEGPSNRTHNGHSGHRRLLACTGTDASPGHTSHRANQSRCTDRNLSSIHQNFVQQEQQRVAVGPGNAHFISIRQVSSDAATLRRGTCCCSAAATAAAAANAAEYRQFADWKLIIIN